MGRKGSLIWGRRRGEGEKGGMVGGECVPLDTSATCRPTPVASPPYNKHGGPYVCLLHVRLSMLVSYAGRGLCASSRARHTELLVTFLCVQSAFRATQSR